MTDRRSAAACSRQARAGEGSATSSLSPGIPARLRTTEEGKLAPGTPLASCAGARSRVWPVRPGPGARSSHGGRHSGWRQCRALASFGGRGRRRDGCSLSLPRPRSSVRHGWWPSSSRRLGFPPFSNPIRCAASRGPIRTLIDERIFEGKERARAVSGYVADRHGASYFLKSDDVATESEYRVGPRRATITGLYRLSQCTRRRRAREHLPVAARVGNCSVLGSRTQAREDALGARTSSRAQSAVGSSRAPVVYRFARGDSRHRRVARSRICLEQPQAIPRLPTRRFVLCPADGTSCSRSGRACTLPSWRRGVGAIWIQGSAKP